VSTISPNAHEAYLAGVLSLPEYQRRRQELDTRNASLEQQARELTAHVDRQQEISHMAASMEDFCQRIQTGLTKASFAQKRTLVERLPSAKWRELVGLVE
jgi:site-specific DNA recombinase